MVNKLLVENPTILYLPRPGIKRILVYTVLTQHRVPRTMNCEKVLPHKCTDVFQNLRFRWIGTCLLMSFKMHSRLLDIPCAHGPIGRYKLPATMVSGSHNSWSHGPLSKITGENSKPEPANTHASAASIIEESIQFINPNKKNTYHKAFFETSFHPHSRH